METALDNALAAALADENSRGDFYTLLLNSPLYMPTWDKPEEEATITSDGSQEIAPLIIENEAGRFVMLFDTEERLSSWAAREVGFVIMQGYDLLQMMGGQVSWALNIGTDHLKIFSPDELEWLQANIQVEQPNA